MGKRTLAHALIIIGAALIIIAVLLPTFLVPRLRTIPLDLTSRTVTNVQEGALLDSGLLAEGKVAPVRKNDPRCKATTDEEKRELPIHCFINEVEIQSIRQVGIEEPSDADMATFQVGTTLLRQDKEGQEALINATVDYLPLDRHTAFPVDEPISSVLINAPAGGEDQEPPLFTREGVQYQFPFDTQKKTYPYFDVQSMRHFDIDFVGEEKQDGETVYTFSQTIPPQNLYESLTEHFTRDGRKLTEADKNSLASLRLKFPAKVWGLEGDEDVEMDRYYTNVRTVRVEPATGMIVNGTEELFMFYAKDQAEAEQIASEQGREKERQERNRTALDYNAQWSDETMATQLASATASRDQLTAAGVIAPWVIGLIGLVLLIIGFRTHRRS